jgi:photosystem II stability/assembly factor-like uncharacterized protein
MAEQLFVSTRKGLFVFAREGSNWRVRQTAFLGQNVTLTSVVPGLGWYAALNLGHFGVKLQRSTDEGRTWEEFPVPAYPQGETFVTGDGKPARPANLQLIWALEPGGADHPQRLWAGTLPGGLFRSDDAGRSWELMRGLWDVPERSHWFGGGYDVPGIHSICVDPRDSRQIRLAVSCGGVWLSADAGQTWRVIGEGLFATYMPPEQQHNLVIQDPHLMVQCRSSPDHLWIQHHNGVFRSSDGGLHWSVVPDVPPSVFGFAVAVHPRDPNTAWLVPAIKDEQRIPVDGKLVVARTRDGGRSFTVLRQGLPQEHAYDLVYRHGLAIDERGDRLAFGSTTGGLWLTDDQGDSWQTLSAHLPPIHAVAFV